MDGFAVRGNDTVTITRHYLTLRICISLVCTQGNTMKRMQKDGEECGPNNRTVVSCINVTKASIGFTVLRLTGEREQHEQRRAHQLNATAHLQRVGTHLLFFSFFFY